MNQGVCSGVQHGEEIDIGNIKHQRQCSTVFQLVVILKHLFSVLIAVLVSAQNLGVEHVVHCREPGGV